MDFHKRMHRGIVILLLVLSVVLVGAPLMAASASSQVEYVYVTSSGKKYHRSSCRTIKNSKVTQLTKEQAQKKYDACKVCNP